MKKKMIVGIALVMGMLSVGAVSASTAGSCCNDGNCADKQAFTQFSQEAATLSGAVKAKDIELKELNYFEGYDIRRANELEAEIKTLKARIKQMAEKHGLLSCCLS